MTATAINEAFFTSPQISTADVERLGNEGFDAIICNRPDGEDPGQPPFADIANAAAQNSIAAVHIPMAGGISPDMLEATQNALAGKTKVLAYCRSGRRSTVLWAAASVHGGKDISAVVAELVDAGVGTAEEWHQILAPLSS